MDIKTVGKWSYLVGLLVAIVAALAGLTADWLGWVLAALAILAGLFFMDTDELVNYGIRYLVLAAVADTLDVIPLVGPFITTIAKAMVDFFGPIILTVLFVFTVKQAVKWIKSK